MDKKAKSLTGNILFILCGFLKMCQRARGRLKCKNLTFNTPTSAFVSWLSGCPHSVFSLADLRTLKASWEALLISPIFRNPSKLLFFPIIKLFNSLAARSSTVEGQV